MIISFDIMKENDYKKIFIDPPISTVQFEKKRLTFQHVDESVNNAKKDSCHVRGTKKGFIKNYKCHICIKGFETSYV